MRIGDAIHNLDGQPFRTLELAERMCRLLAGETATPYRPEAWPAGGYVVRRAAPLPAPAERMVSAPPPVPNPASRSTRTAPEFRTRTYHPAVFRANVRWWPMVVVATAMAFFALDLVRLILALTGFSPAQMGKAFVWTVEGLALAGKFWLGTLAVFLWVEWASQAYIVSAGGIEARTGVFARRTLRLRYEDIRSVSLEQTFSERLLNYGHLDFTSAGTLGAPVRFACIARPARIQALIEARMASPGRSD